MPLSSYFRTSVSVTPPRQIAAAKKVAGVALGTLALAISSQIAVPMFPVPITMQTFVVTMIGALYGWRLGFITVAAWLVEGAVGMPVFANGGGGVAHLLGPTGGYLLSFPIAAALVGWLVERGWGGSNLALAFLAMLAGTCLSLVLGATWLAATIGVENAVIAGVLPFLLGSVLKSALGAAVLKALPVKLRRVA
jgi:biotin transport system substrate-specific component